MSEAAASTLPTGAKGVVTDFSCDGFPVGLPLATRMVYQTSRYTNHRRPCGHRLDHLNTPVARNLDRIAHASTIATLSKSAIPQRAKIKKSIEKLSLPDPVHLHRSREALPGIVSAA